MKASSREPCSDCEFTISENPHGGPDTQAFGQGAQDFPHATGRRFEAVQDGAVADAELGLAGLALEVLDVFSPTVAATADGGVDLVIGDAEVRTVGVGTGVPGCCYPFPATTRAFYLRICLREYRCGQEARMGGATSGTIVRSARFEWTWCWLGIRARTRSGWRWPTPPGSQ